MRTPGGIGSSGGLDVADSAISDNTVSYTGSLDVEDQSGLAGGISIDQSHRAASDADDPEHTDHRQQRDGREHQSELHAVGFGGGVVAFVPALLEGVMLTGNSVRVTGAGFAGVDGGGMEIDAPVTMRDSVVTQQHRHGDRRAAARSRSAAGSRCSAPT